MLVFLQLAVSTITITIIFTIFANRKILRGKVRGRKKNIYTAFIN